MDRIPVHTSSCAPPVEGRARATTREEDELGGGEPRTGARESSRRPDTGEDGILGQNKGATGILDFCWVCREFLLSSLCFGTRGTQFGRAFHNFATRVKNFRAAFWWCASVTGNLFS